MKIITNGIIILNYIIISENEVWDFSVANKSKQDLKADK